MIGNNFWGGIILIIFYIIAAGSISLFDYFTSQKREWIRKGYHLIFCFSFIIILYFFEDWMAALLVIIAITVLAVLVLKLAEKIPFLMKLNISRNKGTGEIIKQMIYFHSVFIIFLLFLKVLWPQSNYHLLIGVIILGFGDAAAALVGKFWGSRNYKGFFFSSAKTLEGSISFIVFSFVPAFLILYFLAGYRLLMALVVATILVLAASFVEAFSRKGIDTLTVPLSVALLSILLEMILFV